MDLVLYCHLVDRSECIPIFSWLNNPFMSLIHFILLLATKAEPDKLHLHAEFISSSFLLPLTRSLWFLPFWPGDAPLSVCEPPLSLYDAPQPGHCAGEKWTWEGNSFQWHNVTIDCIKGKKNNKTYDRSFLRALSAFSLWMCSIRIRLFLNTLPLALR